MTYLEIRMHSSRMRTARSLPYGGLPETPFPLTVTPLLWTETPLLSTETLLLWTETPLPWTEPPPVNIISDRCKKITLPQLRHGQ